jgi:hypothetical protein
MRLIACVLMTAGNRPNKESDQISGGDREMSHPVHGVIFEKIHEGAVLIHSRIQEKT